MAVKKNTKKKSTKKDNLKLKGIKGILVNIKKFAVKAKDKFLEVYKPYMLWMCFPFILMDVFTFIFGLNISYTNYHFMSPILFNIAWIFLFVGLTLSFKKIIL